MSITKKTVTVLIILATVLLAQNATAVPAYPKPIKVTQPDGTKLTIKLHGDEFYSYKTTEDGYSIIKDKDGYYYYAELVNGNKHVSTNVVAKDPSLRGAKDREALKKAGRGVPAAIASNISNLARDKHADEMRARTVFNHAGNEPAAFVEAEGEETDYLVILVNFNDVTFNSANPNVDFDNFLNQEGYSDNGGTGSVRDYYSQNSKNKFIPKYTIIGPYNLQHDRAYYGATDPTNEDRHDVNPHAMVSEAFKAAYEAGVDFSKYAEGKYVRDVFIIFAGENEAESENDDAIWPHRHAIEPVVYNGYTLSAYGCTSELSGAVGYNLRPAGIGTFTHEFGHILGWPDFYDTDKAQNGSALTPNAYTLMDNGSYTNEGRTPPPSTAWERYYKGWLEPHELVVSGYHTLEPVTDNNAFMIKTEVENEYFLLETRYKDASVWETTMFEELGIKSNVGLMIFHIDRSTNKISGGMSAINAWGRNKVNCYRGRECFRPVRAKDYNSIVRNWMFPGVNNVIKLSSTLNNDYKAWSGNDVSVTIEDIVIEGNNIKMLVNAGNNEAHPVKVSEGTNDALITWPNIDHSDSFKVDLILNGEVKFSQTTTERKAYFYNLASNTHYQVKLTLVGSNSDDYINYFTTAEVVEELPHIYNIKGVYESDEEVQLRIGGFKLQIIKDITWTIDGAEVTTPTVKLATGTHKIVATMTLSGGSVEKVQKTITVK